jgi:Flp pilus assembly pilin Flp
LHFFTEGRTFPAFFRAISSINSQALWLQARAFRAGIFCTQFDLRSLRPADGAPGSVERPAPPMERDMKNLLKKLMVEEEGQDVIEYALLAAGISIIVIPTVPLIGTAVNLVYGRINTAVGTI